MIPILKINHSERFVLGLLSNAVTFAISVQVIVARFFDACIHSLLLHRGKACNKKGHIVMLRFEYN